MCQTKATFTPSAVEAVRTQLLSHHDTDGAAILLLSRALLTALLEMELGWVFRVFSRARARGMHAG